MTFLDGGAPACLDCGHPLTAHTQRPDSARATGERRIPFPYPVSPFSCPNSVQISAIVSVAVPVVVPRGPSVAR